MSFFKKFKKKQTGKNLAENAGNSAISCRQVGQDLQSFLDGESTEITAEALAAHLEACKDCGLEAEVYQKIKDALARRAPELADDSLARLHSFGKQLAESGDPE